MDERERAVTVGIDTGEYETHDENSQAPELEQPIAPRGI